MTFKKFARTAHTYKWLQCNGTRLHVAIADTAEARLRGLSGIGNLPENEGMLFDFGNDQHLSFWMKGCLQDLSIAFVTKNGIIADIQEMSATSPTQLHHSPIPVKYALEVNPGFFARHNIAVGDKISI